jgi:hypothetical protein
MTVQPMTGWTPLPNSTWTARTTTAASPMIESGGRFRWSAGWSGRRESNPRSQFGRLGLYH